MGFRLWRCFSFFYEPFPNWVTSCRGTMGYFSPASHLQWTTVVQQIVVPAWSTVVLWHHSTVSRHSGPTGAKEDLICYGQRPNLRTSLQLNTLVSK